MKFLLTSAGITNASIAHAVTELVGKPAGEISVLFIPTAANTIADDKSWLIENLIEFHQQRYKSVDILDIAGLPEETWRPHFDAADLICFGGGNEQYLAKAIRESGLESALPGLVENRVYMGISAGSMVAGKFLSQKLMRVIYPEETFEELAPPLGYVDCLFIPHLNSDFFTHARKETLESLRSEITTTLYACDDASALKIVGDKIEIVTEGETLIFEPAAQ